MCLSLRLGPIDVNWKQSLVDEARESLFCSLSFSSIVFLQHPRALSDGTDILCSFQALGFSFVDRWSRRARENSKLHSQHQSKAPWSEGTQRSSLSEPEWYSIWHKTDSKTKMSARTALMSKYCCDLKWNYDCNKTLRRELMREWQSCDVLVARFLQLLITRHCARTLFLSIRRDQRV